MDDLLAEVKDVMYERGSKYGPGNIAEFGDYGVMVRLSDKLARLRFSRDKDFADERARDAWLDIIGYGIIGLAWADGRWPGSPVDARKTLELNLVLQMQLTPSWISRPKTSWTRRRKIPYLPG